MLKNLAIGDSLTQLESISAKLSSARAQYADATTFNGIPADHIVGFAKPGRVDAAYAEAVKAVQKIQGIMARQLAAYAKAFLLSRPACADEHLPPERERVYFPSRNSKVALATKAADQVFADYEYREQHGLESLYGDNMYLFSDGWYRLDVKPPPEDAHRPNDRPRMVVALNAATLASRGDLKRALLSSAGCADCLLWEATARSRRVIP